MTASETLRPGEKAVRKIPADAAARLGEWFSRRIDEEVAVTEFGRPADGFSGDTFLVTLVPRRDVSRLRRVVVRSDVRENVMIPLRAFSHLYRVQAALRGTPAVPIPEVLFVESDEAILGAPFYVSEFVDGRAPGDGAPYTLTGWVPQSTSDELRTMMFSGIETLARLHAVDWEARGLAFLRRETGTQSELQADVSYFVDCCDWAYGDRWSLVDQVVDWLRARWPKTERLRFSWGDARLGNMLWRDHRPVAVLDWDWAAICDPGRDLGYWLFSHHYFSNVLPGLPLAWPTPDEIVRRYEACSGNEIHDLPFWKAYGCFRQLALMIRVAQLMKAEGTAPTPDFVEQNPVADCMRAIIGDPAGAARPRSFDAHARWAPPRPF